MKIKSGTIKHKKKQLVTALEISDKWLRVVQAECHKRRKVISTIVTKKIDSLTDDRISGEIAKLTNELKINSHYLTISVPRNVTTTRNLELPSIDAFEIKDMIELQIG